MDEEQVRRMEPEDKEQGAVTGEDDTEGHTFLHDTYAAREISRQREREVERAARERAQRRDGRGGR